MSGVTLRCRACESTRVSLRVRPGCKYRCVWHCHDCSQTAGLIHEGDGPTVEVIHESTEVA